MDDAYLRRFGSLNISDSDGKKKKKRKTNPALAGYISRRRRRIGLETERKKAAKSIGGKIVQHPENRVDDDTNDDTDSDYKYSLSRMDDAHLRIFEALNISDVVGKKKKKRKTNPALAGYISRRRRRIGLETERKKAAKKIRRKILKRLKNRVDDDSDDDANPDEFVEYYTGKQRAPSVASRPSSDRGNKSARVRECECTSDCDCRRKKDSEEGKKKDRLAVANVTTSTTVPQTFMLPCENCMRNLESLLDFEKPEGYDLGEIWHSGRSVHRSVCQETEEEIETSEKRGEELNTEKVAKNGEKKRKSNERGKNKVEKPLFKTIADFVTDKTGTSFKSGGEFHVNYTSAEVPMEFGSMLGRGSGVRSVGEVASKGPSYHRTRYNPGNYISTGRSYEGCINMPDEDGETVELESDDMHRIVFKINRYGYITKSDSDLRKAVAKVLQEEKIARREGVMRADLVQYLPFCIAGCIRLLTKEWPACAKYWRKTVPTFGIPFPVSMLLIRDYVGRQTVIGHVRLYTSASQETKRCLLESLVIKKKFRRKKWATFLLRKAEEYAAKQGVQFIYAATAGAQPFFISLGYTIIAPLKANATVTSGGHRAVIRNLTPYYGVLVDLRTNSIKQSKCADDDPTTLFDTPPLPPWAAVIGVEYDDEMFKNKVYMRKCIAPFGIKL